MAERALGEGKKRILERFGRYSGALLPLLWEVSCSTSLILEPSQFWTLRERMIHGPELHAPVPAALAGWEDAEETRRSRGAAATPLLGPGFNYLPAKLEHDFMLGKSLSDSEELIRMENAPERGVWKHRRRVPSADPREERTARAWREGGPRVFWKRGSSTFGNREGNGKGRG